MSLFKTTLVLALSIIFLAPTSSLAIVNQSVNLTVPYIPEAPGGNWNGPWKNACEEASVTMVDQFYLGKTKTTTATAKSLMQTLFDWETKTFGSNSDTDTLRTQKMIAANLSFRTTIKDNPTLAEIKAELLKGHPVISFHYGFDLHNPLIPFLRTGSSYHVMVIVGFDDATKEFIVNDVGNEKSGLDYRYQYEVIMSSLHDFNHQTKKANGTPRVLFTSPDFLAKAVGNDSVYWVKDDQKHHILNPQVFKIRGWKWSNVKIVEKEWLKTFTLGEVVSE